MSRVFAVFGGRGPGWEPGRPMEEQAGWADHVCFMDGVEAEGFVRFAGPLGGSEEVLIILLTECEDEDRRRFADDPWNEPGLLVIREIRPWEPRIGNLG